MRLPALTDQAAVSRSCNTIEAELALPEAGQKRRLGVQWLGPLAFGINAFWNGAGYGDVGHVSAADAGRPAAGPQEHGFLTLLGDDTVERPMLAEVYTYLDCLRDVPFVAEAAITEKTCGQDLPDETLTVAGGAVAQSDRSVSMPGCDAAGDVPLLKDLVPDMTLSSVN